MFGLVGCDDMFLQPSDAQSLHPPADTYMALWPAVRMAYVSCWCSAMLN